MRDLLLGERIDKHSLPSRCPQYEEGSAPSLALAATIEKTEKRFDAYGKAGLLCGAEGLPHLISDPGFALKYGHGGDVFVSSPSPARANERKKTCTFQWQHGLFAWGSDIQGHCSACNPLSGS